MSESCCCGRVHFNDSDTESIRIGETVHERVGQGLFCGPRINHELRDARAEVDRLKSELAKREAKP